MEYGLIGAKLGYHIPLITVPKTTQYETMILSIMEPLMRQMLRKQSTMQRYNEVHRNIVPEVCAPLP